MTSFMMISYIYMFVVGSCLASFIHVIIYRLPLGISFVKGRSFCQVCHHQLHALDLIPVLSWLFLKGRCRYCHSKISIKNPLFEIFGGLLGILCFYRFGFDMMTLLSLVIGMIFIAISIIDLKTMTIPNGFIVALGVVVIVSMICNRLSLQERLIGVVSLSLPLMICNCIVPESFGGGDIKLLAVCGMLLGWKKLCIGMFIAVICAGLYAGYLLILKKVEKTSHIAFGPYLCMGIYISLLWGESLLQGYLHFFYL